MKHRTETDFIGSLEIPTDALYGIHSLRAQKNFSNSVPFHKTWFTQIGLVKLACYTTYKKFKRAAEKKYDKEKLPIQFFKDEIIDALLHSATEIYQGRYFDSFIAPAIQGGAGTSINMNVNEIIANVALHHIHAPPGRHSLIHPIDHANVFQSTNDVIPTSLKICCMKLLQDLEGKINMLRFQIEAHEKAHRNTLRMAHTQLQEAVPSSYGRLFGSYNEALSRDWWRVSKCFERIKVVNIGGSAAGTGITVPRYFIMEVPMVLQQLTGLPVTRSENLLDATNNLDSFVEVHAILKAHAVNVEKLADDIRILASDLVAKNEILIPHVQVGSSIMPGKINPVIAEYAISVSQKVYANDMLISSLAARGNLDLNPFIPLIGHAIIESIQLLASANISLCNNLFKNLIVNKTVALKNLHYSPAISTALVPYVGYSKATLLAEYMKKEKTDIFMANNKLSIIGDEKLRQILNADELLKLGFSLKDIEK